MITKNDNYMLYLVYMQFLYIVNYKKLSWGLNIDEQKITETFVGEKIKEFLVAKQNGNWHEEKSKISDLLSHGADIVMTGGSKNGERFIIECKGKSYSKSANSANKEGWLNALVKLLQEWTQVER